MMQALLLGAGASHGTCPSVPVARDFGRALASLTRYSNDELLEIVEKLDLDRDGWALEDVWTYLDYYSKLHTALRPEAEGPTESHLKRALLEVYGQRCDGLADELPCCED
jgi:hypothetical protein